MTKSGTSTIVNSHSEDSERSEMDGIDDIRRMSVNAMKMLDSLTDEVNEIAAPTSSKKKKLSPSSSRGSSPVPSTSQLPNANGHDMALSQAPEQVTPSPEKKIIQHIDDLDVGGDESEHDDDSLSYDGSFINEMEALNDVAREIERELNAQDTQTMQKAMLELQHSPVATLRERIIDMNDREIIRKVLEEEMIKVGAPKPKSQWEKFTQRMQAENLTSEQNLVWLASSAAVVWSVVAGLVYKSLYGDII